MEIRSIESTYQSNDNIIEGIAIRFNSVSNILYDKEHKRFFREVIDSNAITQNLIDNSNIKFLINHNKTQLVARRKNGVGSLNVELREDGVYFSFEIPNTTLGNDLKEMIRRGDITTCSFAFTDGEVEWDFSDRECPTRTVKSIRALYDLSAVYDAAYDQTEITTRSLEELIDRETQETTEEVEERSTDETTEVSENNNNVTPNWKEELDSYRQRLN